MKQLILLEQFILDQQATNAEHKKAIQWVVEIQQYNRQLESRIKELESQIKQDKGE